MDIVHLYQRGGISRRGFLDRAAKFAVGGLTAAAILENVQPGDASAQQVRKRPQRVAVIGVDHYHATSTPNYLRILQSQKLDILGVHAPDAGIAVEVGGAVRQHAVHGLPGDDRQDEAGVRRGAGTPCRHAGRIPVPRRERVFRS